MGYTASNGIGVYGEAYYQPEEIQSAKTGENMNGKDKTYLKLGVDYTF